MRRPLEPAQLYTLLGLVVVGVPVAALLLLGAPAAALPSGWSAARSNIEDGTYPNGAVINAASIVVALGWVGSLWLLVSSLRGQNPFGLVEVTRLDELEGREFEDATRPEDRIEPDTSAEFAEFAEPPEPVLEDPADLFSMTASDTAASDTAASDTAASDTAASDTAESDTVQLGEFYHDMPDAEIVGHTPSPPAGEPPMIVPVRAYYFARAEDSLRSISAQFLQTPTRWEELRALNVASPGVADAGPDTVLAPGTALALPGDPLPWGRPDPVYLWTLAEKFLFTAWGREPTPEEVVPFWRGLTSGSQLEAGDFAPPGLLTPPEPATEPVTPPAPDDEPEPEPAPQPEAEPAPAYESAPSAPEPSPATDGSTSAPEPQPTPPAVYESPAAADHPFGVEGALGDEGVVGVEASPGFEPLEPPVESTPSLGVEEALGDEQFFGVEGALGDEGVVGVEASPGFEPLEPPVESTPSLGVEEALGDEQFFGVEGALGDEGVVGVEASPGFEPLEPPVESTPSLGVEEALGDERFFGVEGALGDEQFFGVEEAPGDEGVVGLAAPGFEPPVQQAHQSPVPATHEPLAPEPSGLTGVDLGPIEPQTPYVEAEAPAMPTFMPSLMGAEDTAPAVEAQAVGTSNRSLAGTAIGDAMMLFQLSRLRRRRGVQPAAADPLEESLRQNARVDTLNLIEAAMRHLRAVTVGRLREKPAVLAVRVGTYGFEVLLSRPVEAPEGWQTASLGHVLELPQGVTIEDLDAAGQGPSLCPALVPVGDTAEGPLLLNIEEIGCLIVSGPGTPSVNLLNAVVGTLSTSPLAGDIRIITVGMDVPAGLAGWEKVHSTSFDSPELEELLTTAQAGGGSSLDILVVGPGNDLLIQRAGQVAATPGSRLAMVGATSSVAARWPWRIHVDDTTAAVVHPIACTMAAAQVMAPAMTQLLSDMADAAPADVPKT